jgi:hypothetical protein
MERIELPNEAAATVLGEQPDQMPTAAPRNPMLDEANKSHFVQHWRDKIHFEVRSKKC